MSRSIGIISAIVAMGLTACANLTATATESRSITSDYELDGFRWADGGILAVLFKVYEQDNLVSVCAAYSSDQNRGAGPETFNGRALEGMGIALDGNTLLQNLKFIERIPYSDKSFTGQSSCFLTKVPWKPEYGSSIKPTLKKGPRNIVIYT